MYHSSLACHFNKNFGKTKCFPKKIQITKNYRQGVVLLKSNFFSWRNNR
jgi:hypothetical protein